jgi:hypothetical protein
MSPPEVTSNLAVAEPLQDGSRHMTELQAVHVVVPHAAYEPDTQYRPTEGEGFVAPKLTPRIVTEVPPLAGAFIGV